MNKWRLFLVSIVLYGSVHGQPPPDSAFYGALHFLKSTQTDSTLEGVQYAGEWPVYMELTEPYFFIGRRQKARDSNCFTVSAIHNFLAEIYLTDTSLSQIKPILSKAFSELATYAEGQEYNFWKKLPPVKNHKIGRIRDDLPWVHRPTRFSTRSRLVQKMSNVANDADDTNQANLAVWYHNQIFGDSLKLASARIFERWTDTQRQNRNWFNYLFHTKKNSGAYLTWLGQEYEYGIWTPVHGYLSVLGIFLPSSSSFPRAYVPWIPWGANDVCPVVNANVLTYLAVSNQLTDSEPAMNSAKMISHICKKQMWGTGGVYYPNAYQIPYAVAKAFNSGTEQLREAAGYIYPYLQKSQLENGAFVSREWVNNRDTVQSTANALHAILDLEEKGFLFDKQQKEKAADFLLSRAIVDELGVHWNGGLYFTGGTALRNIIQWRSDAYTTALIARCLQRILLKKSPVFLVD